MTEAERANLADRLERIEKARREVVRFRSAYAAHRTETAAAALEEALEHYRVLLGTLYERLLELGHQPPKGSIPAVVGAARAVISEGAEEAESV